MPLLPISGRFYRAILADRVERVLAPPDADSAGRYHRHGQPALYFTASEEWAYIAVSGYMREDRRPRVIVPIMLKGANVVDQRDREACEALGIDRNLSNISWRKALEEGREPPSWHNADFARAIGADGIIDRSRHIPGGWHITLFRWNELGGPTVSVAGDAVPAVLSDSKEHWG